MIGWIDLVVGAIFILILPFVTAIFFYREYKNSNLGLRIGISITCALASSFVGIWLFIGALGLQELFLE